MNDMADVRHRLAWANACGAELVAAQRAGGLAGARAATREFLRRWPPVPGVEHDERVVRGVPVHRFHPPGGAAMRLLYAHGGGFTMGCGADYRAMLGELAVRAGCQVWACDYRLAPEHPFPAALDDITAVLDDLLDTADAAPVAVGGDSAGGALVVAAVARRIRRGAPPPFAVVLFSPLLDLTATAPSYEANAAVDRMLSGGAIHRIARAYLDGHPADDPEASPLHGDVADFPPSAIYVSAQEVLRDDAVRLAVRLADAGSPVRLGVEYGLPHVWPMFGAALPEALRTLSDAAEFLRTTCALHPIPPTALASPTGGDHDP